jgi:hypothetical protein
MAAIVRDLSELFDRLCRDVCRRVPDLAHIDPDRILFALSRSRADGRHGIQARILPLRFPGGRQDTTRRRGRYQESWRLPGLSHDGREILYLIQFMVPRFLHLSRREKLGTLIHELHHVSPACDGDLRRFPGRNFAHGQSRKAFQRQIDRFLDVYLAAGPDPDLLAGLDLNPADWAAGRLRLVGLQVPLPRARLVARERIALGSVGT